MNNLRPVLLGLAIAMASTSVVNAQEATTPDVTTPDATVPTPAKAEVPTQSVEDRVLFLLSGYEYFPTREDLDAVGGEEAISTLLRTLAADPDQRPSMRLRAVDALGYYDDATTVELLTRLTVEEPKADLARRKKRTAYLLRHHAITALAKSQREASVPTLERLFDSSDVQLVLTVVHALGKHGGKAGAVALKSLQDKTANHVVRREVAKWVK